MDSAGIGGAPDAAEYFNDGRPDTGANTLAHIAQLRGLAMPHLDALGLGAAIRLASGAEAPGLGAVPQGLWGAATEQSRGKDTPSGHWELAGVPVPFDWHYFPDSRPAFPAELSARIARAAGTEGILGNEHASGTEIIARLGAEHLRSGWPICYTSVDSVIQIAAHEQAFGLDRLLRLCQDVAAMVHPMRVGRVIARPFLGQEGGFYRTANRRDYAIAPPAPTLLDVAQDAGRQTHAIGKIGDIFSHRGIGALHKGQSDADLAGHLLRLGDEAAPGSLVFANFVEFDTLYGHRRDVQGYGRALEWFDGVAGALIARLRPGDLAIFTADHGNDPSWHGTDHTRERVPVLGWGYGARAVGQVGFADVAASIAAHLDLPPVGPGRSFL
ncbi:MULTISPECIES: phosphopentomutase [unclassified Paracoccus (in: a-proteobacteria)]|uniref:phosphopentomutase n=1 Tax=unclassified Paracoccus (in: a-proteobacteria) TaxID=2688777 RepID=UPI001E589222|nr:MULTISPECIES: phosphopentomutase [unclassified Paracoccus (in: a-proteobacteria)]UXU76255.1 phosphopentomutase [Paracoccus sp. SMMA_5]UXU82145.1 phosphopentomutase [Paracoccus sp. SMMA_5_TC]